jgi:hypothetical protein
MPLVRDTPHTDFIFGLAGPRILSPMAAPFLKATRQPHDQRCRLARHNRLTEPSATRTYHDLTYTAQTWPGQFRVVLKAEVMTLGDNPRCVVTSLNGPNPESLSGPLLCPRLRRKLDQNDQD